jgi:high-affinity nickel-transport protein
VENVGLNTVGFVIVGAFVAAGAVALSVWKIGRVEERWTAGLTAAAGDANEPEPAAG